MIEAELLAEIQELPLAQLIRRRLLLRRSIDRALQQLRVHLRIIAEGGTNLRELEKHWKSYKELSVERVQAMNQLIAVRQALDQLEDEEEEEESNTSPSLQQDLYVTRPDVDAHKKDFIENFPNIVEAAWKLLFQANLRKQSWTRREVRVAPPLKRKAAVLAERYSERRQKGLDLAFDMISYKVALIGADGSEEELVESLNIKYPF